MYSSAGNFTSFLPWSDVTFAATTLLLVVHLPNSLGERGIEKGSRCQSAFKEQDRTIVIQGNTGTAYKILRHCRMHLGFSKRTDTIFCVMSSSRVPDILSSFSAIQKDKGTDELNCIHIFSLVKFEPSDRLEPCNALPLSCTSKNKSCF